MKSYAWVELRPPAQELELDDRGRSDEVRTEAGCESCRRDKRSAGDVRRPLTDRTRAETGREES